MGFAILNLDIKKAFDTISYAYITMVLEAYGFGPQFQQWLHLYNDVTAKVIVTLLILFHYLEGYVKDVP